MQPLLHRQLYSLQLAVGKLSKGFGHANASSTPPHVQQGSAADAPPLPTTAQLLRSVCLSTIRMVAQLKCPFVAAVFDPIRADFRTPRTTLRDLLLPDRYKNRAEQQKSLPQLDEAHKLLPPLLQALGVPVVVAPTRRFGPEADDIIASITAVAQQVPDSLTTVMSPDKDYFQLLAGNVQLLRPHQEAQLHIDSAATMHSSGGTSSSSSSGEGSHSRSQRRPSRRSLSSAFVYSHYTASCFEKEYHLPPALYRDLLVLAGHSSKGIKGFDGIGIKTATRLLQQYGSVKDVLAHAEEVKPKRVRLSLTAPDAAEKAAVLQQLVHLNAELPDIKSVPFAKYAVLDLDKAKLEAACEVACLTPEILQELITARVTL